MTLFNMLHSGGFLGILTLEVELYSQLLGYELDSMSDFLPTGFRMTAHVSRGRRGRSCHAGPPAASQASIL